MKTHTIHWISSANGRIGKGTKVLEKEEAERLVTELNRDYPEIDHEAVLLAPTSVPAEPVSAKAVQADTSTIRRESQARAFPQRT